MWWSYFDDHDLRLSSKEHPDLQLKQENVTVNAKNHDNTITWSVIQSVIFIYRFEWKKIPYSYFTYTRVLPHIPTVQMRLSEI